MTEHVVIDTSVARSCGSEMSSAVEATACRNALKEIEFANICIVTCKALDDEWQVARLSKWVKLWRSDMYSRRRVVPVDPAEHLELRMRIQELSTHDRAEATKDLFLSECALEVGRRVVSRDDAMRVILGRLSKCVADLATVHWANPVHAEVRSWLRSGAPDEADFMLGAA